VEGNEWNTSDTILPVRTDPVNEILRTSIWDAKAAPGAPRPPMIWMAPGGNPASLTRRAKASGTRGDFSEDFHLACIGVG